MRLADEQAEEAEAARRRRTGEGERGEPSLLDLMKELISNLMRLMLRQLIFKWKMVMKLRLTITTRVTIAS